MSGIYIKGMKMPKSCDECKFFTWKRGIGNHCAINESITFHPTLDGLNVRYEKNGNCPLIAVPDHGRLIDADNAVNDVWYGFAHYTGLLTSMLEDMPTIIPADKE